MSQPSPSQPSDGADGNNTGNGNTNSMAIAAIVLAFVFPPLGAVFGHIARGQIRRTGESGAGLATAGIIVGYLLTALYLLLCCGALVVGGLTTHKPPN